MESGEDRKGLRANGNIAGQSRELDSVLAVKARIQCRVAASFLKLVYATGQSNGRRAKTGNRVLKSGRDFKGDSD